MSPQFESKEEVARAQAAERAQARCHSLEDQLATLRSEVAYVQGHLEGYAESLERFAKWTTPEETLERLTDALREDSRRLGKLGGGE